MGRAVRPNQRERMSQSVHWRISYLLTVKLLIGGTSSVTSLCGQHGDRAFRFAKGGYGRTLMINSAPVDVSLIRPSLA